MTRKRPNILIFNPDQWRGDVMGHLGNPAAATPVLDGLVASDAISFRNAYCQNPVCTPSRCSYMTGWYPHVRGHRTMYHMLHPERDEPNLLRELKDAGYFIWWGGKNDLVPGQDGFSRYADVKWQATDADRTRWGRGEGTNLHAEDAWRGSPDGDNYYSFYAGRLQGKEGKPYCDGDWDDVLGAIDFIDGWNGDQPFCLYLPLLYPHPPYGVEEPWFSSINRTRLPPRIPGLAGRAGKPSLLAGIAERQNLTTWTEERWTELRAAYYGMCARVDHQLGFVLDALKRRGLYDDTAVFFFADHGDFTGDYGLVEKTQNTFEDCLSRVPLIFKPPLESAVVPGVREELVELIDFTETAYELAGLDPRYTRFGKSLLPLARERALPAAEADGFRDAVFCEGGRLRGERQAMELDSTSSQNPQGLYWPRCGLQGRDDAPWHTKAAMCRTRTRKYVMRLYETHELYDLELDPGETVNLIDDPRYAADADRLKERLLRWYMETCDVVPFDTDAR